MDSVTKTTAFAATVENVTTRKDRTLKITIGTQELSPEKMTALFAMQNSVGYMAIKPENFGKDELAALEAAKADYSGDTNKPASQRLRAVLFRLWEQKPEGFETSVLHYESEMERIITHYKNKLD